MFNMATYEELKERIYSEIAGSFAHHEDDYHEDDYPEVEAVTDDIINLIKQFIINTESMQLQIINFESFLDGGTIEITTNQGIFSYDHRLFSKTQGSLYIGYPKDDNSNIIENSKDIELQILKALKLYSTEFYQETIECLIKQIEQKYNL